MVARRLPIDERKRQTLSRVSRVFARKGFSATSAELARAARISEAMLYKLFGNKRGLYKAMVHHKLADAGWGDFPDPAECGSEREYFTLMAEKIFLRVAADPDVVRLLTYSDLQGGEFSELFHEALGEQVLGQVGDYLRERIAAGSLREVDPDLTGMAFLCMVWQYAVGTKVFAKKRLPQVPDELAIETLVSLFLQGVTQ